MDITLFVFFIFSLQGICFLSAQFATKKMESQEDYFLAGKALKFFPLMMTFIATQVGGCLVLGAAEEAYLFGWTVLFYPIGACLGLVLLGLGVGKRLASFNVSTVAQIFEKSYGSKKLKKAASFLSIVSLFLIFVAQIVASKKFMVSAGFDNTFLFLIFWGIVIAYTAIGGLKAVIATDIVQASFFIAAFLICFITAFFKAPESLNFPPEISENASLKGSKFVGWLFMPLLFMLIEQDMAQRCFAAASSKVIAKASLLAACATFLICLIPIYFGKDAKALGLATSGKGSVLMEMIQLSTNPLVTALVGAALLAAIISTADSLLNALTSNLLLDFDWLQKKNSIRTSQLITGLIAIAGVFVSFYFNNLVDLVIQSYELSVYCLFIPILMAMFKPQGNKMSAALAMLFGALSFSFFQIKPIGILPKEIVSVGFSFLGFLIGEAMVLIKIKKESYLT